MPLVTLQDRPASCSAIRHAAGVLWRASIAEDDSSLCPALQNHFSDPSLTAVNLHTGINRPRRGVVMCTKDSITLAFQGCHPDEAIQNLWVCAKGPNWWDIPFPVFSDGNLVHSFFRDLWWDMRRATLEALDEAIRSMVARGTEPKEVIVTGFSMGGGISMYVGRNMSRRVRSRSEHPLTNPRK